MTRAKGILNYPLNVVIKAFDDPEIRSQWETGVDNEIISTRNEGNLYIEQFRIYITLKVASNREFIQEKKKWVNYAGDPNRVLYSLKSIEHPNYPLLAKVVRAETYVGGYYFEAIGENQTKVIILNHANMKFPKVLAGIVNKKTVESAEEYFKNFEQGCQLASQ